MKHPVPVHESTRTHPKTGEWLPHSFEACLVELEHLKRVAAESNALLLFRGHSRREWRLDSTFVRSVKSQLLDMNPVDGFAQHLWHSADLNASLSNLLLLKFGTLVGPSAELLTVAAKDDVDPWFELMKRFQQYPNEDELPLKGTNLVDWSQSCDVALYFANEHRETEGSGAIFICDATATGKTLQTIPVADILAKVRAQVMQGLPNGAPLLFSPKRQIAYQRAKNQQAVYFAQMDLRLDLLEVWRLQEQQNLGETIVVKVVLPPSSEQECAGYLASKGIKREFLYPDFEGSRRLDPQSEV
jgi:hypothetical protein